MANGLRRSTRLRGNTQFPIALFGALALALLLLGKTQGNMLDQARAALIDWASPGLAAIHAPFEGFNRWLANADDMFNLYQENVRLKEDNARLRQWQGAALALEARVGRYEQLLNAVPERKTESVLARVIGRSGRPFLETMILDAGTANGVKPGEAVLDPRGLVGRVYLAGQNTSWVILLRDVSSRVPVVIQPGNIPAMLTGDNTAAPRLEALPPRTELKPGSVIVTSGDGGLLPAGLAVGTVVAQAGKYRAALYAEAHSTSEVEILRYQRLPEQAPPPSLDDIPDPGPMPAQVETMQPPAQTDAQPVPPPAGQAAPVAPAVPDRGQAGAGRAAG